MDWQLARREIGELRHRAYLRALASGLRHAETVALADRYAPPSPRMLMLRGTVVVSDQDGPLITIGDRTTLDT